jgi:HemY protein
MKGLLWIVGTFLLAAVAALVAQVNDGYVLIVFPPYRIDVSLNLAIFLLVLAYLAVYALFSTVSAIFRVPQRVAEYRARKAQEKGMGLFLDSFRQLFEGRHADAMKKAEQAYERGAAPALSALVAARAAQRLRRSGDQQLWLERASAADSGADAARCMLEAEMHLDARDFESAIAAIESLPKAAGRNVAAQRLELRARQGAGQWDEVLRVTRQLEKREGLPPEVLQEAKIRAHLEKIGALASDSVGLSNYLKSIPKGEQHIRLVRAVARELGDLGACDSAAQLIERQLRQEWDDDLVALYARCGGDEMRATRRLSEAEKWLRERPKNANLLRTLGLLCLDQRLWGKAQSYLEASLSIEKNRETHQALARLFDATERRENADRHYRALVPAAACPAVSGESKDG